MAPVNTQPARKRNRKRKRRVASSSSSSSSSSDSSSDEGSSQTQDPPSIAKLPIVPAHDSSEDASSDSELSDSDSEVESVKAPSEHGSASPARASTDKANNTPRRSPSPPPAVVELPSFLPSKETDEAGHQEQILRERFRKFWMESIAEGFKDDLEEIRKEPNFGPSRLAMLIDSLASGADVFTSRSQNNSDDINEMEVVLDIHSKP